MTNQQALHKKHIPQSIKKSDLLVITHKNYFWEINRLFNEKQLTQRG